MKFLSIFPFLLVIWTMFIFAYQNYNDESYGDMFFYLILVVILLYLAKNKHKVIQKKLDVANIIAINIGLLPLLFSNLVLLPIVLRGEAINESGMVFILVLIYSPMMYVGALVIFKIYSYLTKNRNV